MDKVIGCVIACNEEEFIEASVDSLAPIIDEWIFVIGGNEFAYKSGMCNENGYPIDNTMDIVKQLAKKYKSKVIEPKGLWKDKVEMRNAYTELLKPGEWMFLQDADEVYDTKQLKTIKFLLERFHVISIQYWSFWNNVNTIGTGKWDQYPCERAVKWQKGFAYRNGNHVKVSFPNGEHIIKTLPLWAGKDRLFYHYSWIRPIEKIRQKMSYYKHQSGNNNDSYVDEVFLKWRTDPNSVQGKTHPNGGGGFAPFTGKHPPQIERLIESGRLNF